MRWCGDAVCAALAAAFLIVAFAAPAAGLEIKRSVLANGAVLLVSEQHQLPMITMTIAFDAGARRDPDWGPVIAVGFGGVLVELLDDVRLMAPDATEDEILSELAKLRGAKFLAGTRGAPPADVAALAAIIAKVAALTRAAPDVIEIDLNPVMVYPKGQGACALDALVAVRDG